MRRVFLYTIITAVFAFGQPTDTSLVDSIPRNFQVEPLFPDSLPDSVLYSEKERGFFVNQLVSARRIDSFTIQISNFTPVRFHAMTLISSDSTFTLNIDSLPSFSRITIPVAPPLDTLLSEQFVLTCEDSTFRKINEISVPWFVSFSSHNGGKWGKVTPDHAKKYAAIMANFAWLVSDTTFRTEYLHDTVYVLKNNGVNKNGDTIDPIIDRSKFYNRLISQKAFTFGVISHGVAGLGVWRSADDTSFVGVFQPHSLLGVKYFTWYERESSYAMRILAHETGHIMGFTHASTIAIDDRDDPLRRGFPSMVGNCYLRLLNERKLPFPDDPFAIDQDSKNAPSN